MAQISPNLRNHPWYFGSFGTEYKGRLGTLHLDHLLSFTWSDCGIVENWVELSSFHQPTNGQGHPIENITISWLDFLLNVPWSPSCHVLSKMLCIHLRHVLLKKVAHLTRPLPMLMWLRERLESSPLHRLGSYWWELLLWGVPSLCIFQASKASSSVSEIFSPW